jgi:hypothetical protein
MKTSLFYGTPQAANPESLLKNTMKDRIRQEMEAKLASLPASPYAVTEAETETGSPVEVFTKLKKAATPATAKYFYETMTPTAAAGGGGSALKFPLTSSRRCGPFSTVGTPFTDISMRAAAGSPPRFNLDDMEDDDDVGNLEDNENQENKSFSVVAPSPEKQVQPELVTGALAHACVIS